MYEVHVLQEGYSRLAENGSMLANGSSSLIIGNKFTIIVDTLSPWDSEVLKSALLKHNVKPEDVTHLICTHGHPDHVGNNNLFIHAQQHIVGYSVHHRDTYYIHPFETGENFKIDGDDIIVLPTPGHTNDSISVKVNTKKGIVVIAGDLFEKVEDIKDPQIWKDAGSENEKLQEENRKRVLQMADFIIPGHGRKFMVTDSMRNSVS